MFFCGSCSAAERGDESENDFSSPSRPSKRSGNPFSSRGLDRFAIVSADLKTRAQGIISQLGASPTDDLIVRFAHSGSEGWVPIVVRPKKSSPNSSDPHKKTSSNFPMKSNAKESNLPEKTIAVPAVKPVTKKSKVHDEKTNGTVRAVKPNIKPSKVIPLEQDSDSRKRDGNLDFPEKICKLCFAKTVRYRTENAEPFVKTSSLEANDEKGVGVCSVPKKEISSSERKTGLDYWFGCREVDYRILPLMAIFLSAVVWGRVFAIVVITVLWYLASDKFYHHGKMIPKQTGVNIQTAPI